MVKSGLYAGYQGGEYRAARMADGRVELFADVHAPGFKRTPHGHYSRTLPRDALDALYIVKSYAEVYGERFELESEKDGTYTIGTSDAKLAAQHGFTAKGRRDFRKRIPASAITNITEERTPL